ncbi:MAG: hypothetical protein AAFV69_04985 [Pseudomonadota bacterium]
MAKAFWIFLGLLLIAGAVGALGYRFQQEPDLLSKYERMIEPEVTQAPAPTAPQTRSATPQDVGPEGAIEPRSEAPVAAAKKRVDNVKLLEIVLDVGNILVGLIGIYLAVSGMRMRRQSQG